MGASNQQNGTEPVLYCIVARSAPACVAREMQAGNGPRARVIHDRRRADRRRASRRQAEDATATCERRTIHGFDGRRVADRRAVLVPVDTLGLPHPLLAHRESVRYFERVVPGERDIADAHLARLVLRLQGGEKGVIDEIYRLVFPELYTYFHVSLGDHAEAEDATQQVFIDALTALPRFRLTHGTPVRAWLFSIARHAALKQIKRRHRQVLEEPDDLAQRREAMSTAAEDPELDWVDDADLLAFIGRLPDSQRQVIVLRYMAGLRTNEIAAVLERTNQAVRHLESRALRFLRRRLAAIGRGPSPARRIAA